VVWPYTEAGRFLIPLIPCLLIGAEEGLVAMACQMGRVNANGRRPRRLRLYVSILIFLASLPYSCYMLAAGRTRALEATHRDFDAACSWIAGHAGRPGPVLSRHPGEVFWKTGRQGLEVPTSERPGQRDADSDAIARTIAAYKISYLLIDHERYAGAARSPLAQFVIEHPELVREVWKSGAGGGSVSVYEVHSDR